MPDIIKPKRATKSVADKSDKVLEKDELLLISPNTGSGTGRYGVKIGDGATATKDLPYAIDGEKADEMIVSEFTKESNENPVLSPGDKIKTLCGKLLKKFTYIETLLGKKVNTSDIYDGTDSSSTTKVATANSVRQVNEKADNNTNQINQLNSNFSFVANDLNQVPSEVKFFKFANAKNAPELTAGIGIQLYYDGNFRLQIVTVYGSRNSLWIRQTSNGEFLAWTKIL